MPVRKCPHCGEKLEKVARAPTPYNLFVQQAMKRSDVMELSPSTRMKAVAVLWRRRNKKKAGKESTSKSEA